MKSFLIFILAVTPFLLLNGQNGKPKSVPWITAGVANPDDEYEQINGQKSLKSASSNPYATGKSLSFPGYSGGDDIRISKKNGAPVFIERRITPLKAASMVTHEEQFYTFLEESSDVTKVTDPRETFKISGIHTDKLGITHVKAIQQYKGIEVYGSESILHIDEQKERFTGSFCMIDQGIPDKPAIGDLPALQKAIDDLQKVTSYRELSASEKKLLHYESPVCSLVIYDRGKNNYALTWAITIRPNLIEEWKYFIDAINGEIIQKFNNTKSDGPTIGTGLDLNGLTRSFDVYLTGGIYYLFNIAESMYNPATNQGIIITLDANNTSTVNLDYSYVTSVDNTWTQKAAISAHYNAHKTYGYFDTTFNRKSVNGNGENIISLVNVVADDGSLLENAFWNGQAVFYGNGGEHLKPLAGALDVTAHELTHGVVSATANLEYYGQSGSINESFADFFACMIDSSDWLIGEDITMPDYSPSGALRNMADPHNMSDTSSPFWQPAHTSEMILETSDNGSVHLNSGIVNYAFYLYATAVGKRSAEQVCYRALTEYLTKTSGFIHLRIAIIQSARDLYGEFSPETVEAARAFDAVGIYEEDLVYDNPQYETNPGEKCLLSYDTSSSDPVSLYLSSAEGTNYRQLTKTSMKGKVSVTDDGSTGVFVSNDSRLRMINLDPANTNERIISGNAFYSAVAISKDGKRLAATRVFNDASIFLIDLESGEGRQFILYNPTTSNSNITAGGVIKADAVEFDNTGEYLIYDAYNVLNSNSLKDIYYWDIGFIKVWDNNIQNFGDGSITKLFNSLPANVSIANPVFSKNSPLVIAFDYYFDDGVIEEYGIYGANLETGEIKKITTNDRLGYPSYSTNDEKIAYSTINGLNRQVIKDIKLYPDKITPKGDPGVLVPDAKWPVYFATGIRALGFKPAANFSVDFKNGDLPLSVRFMDLSKHHPTSWQWTFEGGTPSSSGEQNPSVTYESAGKFKVMLEATNHFGSDTLVKESYITVDDPTGTALHANKNLRIFPNPVDKILSIESDEDYTVRIYNAQGVLMLMSANKSTFDLSNMVPGIYVLELKTGMGLIQYKLIKQ